MINVLIVDDQELIRSGLRTIVEAHPELTVAEQDTKFGKDLFASDPASCCTMRKGMWLRVRTWTS